jgi:hypothetical protein
MANFGPRRGAANLGLPLMLATFVLLGGFMYWLYVTAEPTQPPEVEEVEEAPEDNYVGTTVAAEDLKTGADAYVGQVIRVRGLEVSSTMGRQAFFLDLPASDDLPATPFLIRMVPALADSMRVGMGDEATVVGTLMLMTDSIVNDWVESGGISENDRLLVEFATHFIEADEIQTTTPAPEGGSAGS